ncbi:amidohydrolase [Clostridium sp. DL1XJH146]
MDLILINGKIITMDINNPKVEAVGIKNGKFSKVGTTEQLLPLKTPNTRIIDLNGKMLVPGFNDSHMHLINYGYSLQMVDLKEAKSLEDLITLTKEFISKSKLTNEQWINGRGWNQDHFSKKDFPTRYDLDNISTEYPICLTRACGHILVVNSKALELSNINKTTLQIEGGKFDVDEQGNPTGIFREKSTNLIYSKIPSPTKEEIKEIIVNASNHALKQGITSIQTDDFESLPGITFDEIINAYTELKENKELPVRIYEQCLLPHITKLNKFIDLGYKTGDGDEFFKIGPLKLLGDGSLGARTAYLTEPYNDDPSTRGISIFTQEELDQLIIKAHNSNLQIAVHCIGDKIMYMVFDSFKKAQKQNPKKDARHGIVHCQITDKTLLNKFKEQNVHAYIQPIFLDYDLHIVEDRIGKEKTKTSYNWKELFNKNISISFGSDCPVEPFDVLPGIYCAVTRKDLKGYPKSGWLPDQKLTIDQALFGFTLGGAFASFEENIKGSIEIGKLADMVVLSEDIYSISPDKIKDVLVEMTFVEGNLVYKK